MVAIYETYFDYLRASGLSPLTCQPSHVERPERLEDVKVHDLYQHYPNMFIDVAREQRMLRDYDIIIFSIRFTGIPARLF